MGTLSLLTKEQKVILDEIRKSDFLKSNFYFTGGTTLSSFYLHHRYSEDLDFFSEEKFDNQSIFTLVEKWSKNLAFKFDSEFRQVVYVFNIEFKNKIKVKLDFGYYPYKRIDESNNLNGLKVDSLLDIAVNKLLTITQRDDVKDFVDLYFLLDKFTVWDLIEGVKVKFGMKLEPFIVASDFLKVEDFDFLPKMIKPLSLEELKKYFRIRAKELGRKVTE